VNEIGSVTGRRTGRRTGRKKRRATEKKTENEKKSEKEKDNENGLPKQRTSGWMTTTGTSSGWTMPSETGCQTGNETPTGWRSSN
jgi:hypothetical protein